MSNLPEGWVETTLAEVVSHLGDGLHGTPKYDAEGEYYFINGNNLRDGRIVFTKDTKRTSVEEFKKYKKDLNNRTLLVSINGTLGNVAEYNDEKCFLGKSACYFNVLGDVSKLFIKYTLTNRHFQKYIDRLAGGTTIKNVSLKTMREYPINLPPLPEQKAIADVLSSFDEKIELLREQNKTLETLAQMIFKEWFCEFEFPQTHPSPDLSQRERGYKSSGGEMVESELGLIPKGWRVERLGDALEVKRGGSPRPIKDYISDSGYHWLKISDATATSSPFIFEVKEHIKKEGLKKTTLLKKGSLVLSNSATPGVPKFLELDSCIHDGWLHFPSTNIFSYHYLYLFFQHIRKPLLQQGNGSVFKNLKTDILKDWMMVVPDIETMDGFNELIVPIFEKIKNNASQIQTLSKARDTLLPKLMSGQVRPYE